MNKFRQQSVCSTDYFYSQPLSRLPPNILLYNFDYIHCPLYAPVVPDGMCRLCHKNSSNHRRYYIYSNYARKIQKAFFKYQFKKFFILNQKKFKRLGKQHLPYHAAIFKYKILYYRNWSTFTLERFINSNNH